MRSLRNDERHCLGLLWDALMDGIHQFDPDLVRTGRQQGHVDRGSTHVRPQPWQVVHVHVQMFNRRIPGCLRICQVEYVKLELNVLRGLLASRRLSQAQFYRFFTF